MMELSLIDVAGMVTFGVDRDEMIIEHPFPLNGMPIPLTMGMQIQGLLIMEQAKQQYMT